MIDMTTLATETRDILQRLGVDPALSEGGTLVVRSPITGDEIAKVLETTPGDADALIAEAQSAFSQWRNVPAPRRGEFVRQLGDALRGAKEDLGRLVSIEVGKALSEGLGEVQEMRSEEHTSELQSLMRISYA